MVQRFALLLLVQAVTALQVGAAPRCAAATACRSSPVRRAAPAMQFGGFGGKASEPAASDSLVSIEDEAFGAISGAKLDVAGLKIPTFLFWGFFLPFAICSAAILLPVAPKLLAALPK